MMINLFLLNLPGSGDVLNPVRLLSPKWLQFETLGGTISALLPYLFLFGGIILLGMLLMGGFDVMTSLGNEEKMQKGWATIRNALLGFLALFGVYWLAQIVQILFKIPIL